MLKYLLFIMFFAGMVLGYLLIGVPPDSSYDETLTRVWRGVSIVFLCGIGSFVCLHRISK